MKTTDEDTNRRDARPTLKTIAQISGLAITTVSRALGDAPDISARTKDRVRKIAQDIGYVPNRAGVRLRTGKTNVISLVLAAERNTLNMTSDLISSISNGLRGTRYHLVMIPEPEGQAPLDAIQNIVETRSADAIIFNRVEPDDARVTYLLEKKFPFVTHGRSKWSDDHSYFDFDNYAFGRIAVESLVQRGRKRILLLAPPTTQSYAREMISGARDAAMSNDVDLVVPSDISSDSVRHEFIDGLRGYLNGSRQFDAIVSASPNSTMLATTEVENAGLQIGDQIDIFSKETVPFIQLFRPAILSVREDVEKAGNFLAKAAVHEITKTDESHLQCLDKPLDPNTS